MAVYWGLKNICKRMGWSNLHHPRRMQELHGFPLIKGRRGNNFRPTLKTNDSLIGIWELRMAEKTRTAYLQRVKTKRISNG